MQEKEKRKKGKGKSRVDKWEADNQPISHSESTLKFKR